MECMQKLILHSMTSIHYSNPLAIEGLSPHRHLDLSMRPSNLDTIREQITAHGLCILHDCKPDDALVIAGKLGEVVGQTDVTVNHSKGGPLVTSDRALGIHTDHHDVKFILWLCQRQSSQGGYSLLSDFETFSQDLNPGQIDVLKNVLLFEHDVFSSGDTVCPLLRSDEDGLLKIYFSYWHVSEDDKNNEAVHKFHALAKQHTWKYRLTEGDILIVNNQRVLHGRTAIIGDKSRLLKRYWIR